MRLNVVQTSDDLRAVESAESDETGFDFLYRNFHPRLVAMLRRRTDDPALAEDLAQETLLRAYLHLERFDRTRPMWPWLKTIASRLVIDHARCREREILCDAEQHGSSTDDAFLDDGLLRAAMENLTRPQKIALSLRYLDDWKSSEAANFLGINRMAFEQLLLRARRKLRTEYLRVSNSALGVLSLRHLKRALARLSRVGRAQSSSGPLGGVGMEALTQLATGAIAVITAVSTSVMPLAPVAAPAPVAIGETESGSRTRSSNGASGLRVADTGGGSTAHAPAAATNPGPPNDSAAGLVDRITDPNRDVQEPEDARILSFAPGDPQGETVYAIGATDCSATCGNVLFRSVDGGSTWERLEAAGLKGDELLIPPHGDGSTIFAMSTAGLQVSRDGGRSFMFASMTGAPFLAGSAAVSPAFFSGDRTVLVGTQTLMRYRDETRTMEPYPAPIAGPLAPVFSPSYPGDPRILVGGVNVDAKENTEASVVHTCVGSMCTEARLAGSTRLPLVWLPDNFSSTHLSLAFTESALYRSIDGGTSYSNMNVPLEGRRLRDAIALNADRLFVAVDGHDGAFVGGLFHSADGGRSWAMSASPLFDGGATSITTVGRTIYVALRHQGFACSTDAGATWSTRC